MYFLNLILKWGYNPSSGWRVFAYPYLWPAPANAIDTSTQEIYEEGKFISQKHKDFSMYVFSLQICVWLQGLLDLQRPRVQPT